MSAGSTRAWARLVLGAVRVVLLPPPGLASYGRAAGRAVLVTVIAGVALVAAFGGAFLGIVGAMADRELSVARARARHRPRR